MTKRNKRRVAVHDGERYIGILEDIDLLGFLAGSAQSSLVASIARRAGMTCRLPRARTRAVRTLRRQGVKVEVFAEVVSDLKDGCSPGCSRWWHPTRSVRSVSVVMGSEGRGEQTVRTDQDNGLILAGPVDKAAWTHLGSTFQVAAASAFRPAPAT